MNRAQHPEQGRHQSRVPSAGVQKLARACAPRAHLNKLQPIADVQVHARVLVCIVTNGSPSGQGVACSKRAEAHRIAHSHVREVLPRHLPNHARSDASGNHRGAVTPARASGTMASISAQSTRSTHAWRVISRTTPPSPPPTCVACSPVLRTCTGECRRGARRTTSTRRSGPFSEHSGRCAIISCVPRRARLSATKAGPLALGAACLVRKLVTLRQLDAAVQHEHAPIRLRIEHLPGGGCVRRRAPLAGAGAAPAANAP